MRNPDQEIKKKIKQTRRRMIHIRLIRNLLFGLVVGTAVAAVIMILSLLIPQYYAPVYAVIAVVLGILSGIVFTLLKSPDMKQSALLLDSKGFQERVITSYERSGMEDPFSMLLKEDTNARLQDFSVREAFPLEISVKQLVLFLGLSVILAIAGMIDSPARKEAREDHALVVAAKEEAEKLSDALEKIQTEETLSAEEQERLSELLDAAKKELSEAGSEEDIEKAKERLEKKLEQEVKDLLAEDKAKEAQAFMELALEMNETLTDEQKEELTKELSQLNELSEELREALSDLETDQDGELSENEAGELSEEELQSLSAKLAEAAANMTDEELQALLSQAAASMSKEDLENALAALSDAQGTAIAAAMDGDGSASLAMGGQGSGGQGTGGQDGTGQGNGGTGDGGQGTGASDGAGGGWYNGSDQGAMSEEAYDGDMVSVPENYQDDENLTGSPTEGDSYKQQGGPSVTWDGIRMNYQDVIRDYETKAYERMEGGNYPANVQDAIRAYFESLNH